MVARLKSKYVWSLLITLILFQVAANLFAFPFSTLHQQAIAKQLGWVQNPENSCGGYFLEQPFMLIPNTPDKSIAITSDEGLYAQYGTSVLENKVTLTRKRQQLTANKAYLYRDPLTQKLSIIDLIGDVHLREPSLLIIGKEGRYEFKNKHKSLVNIFYRTLLSKRFKVKENEKEMLESRKVIGLTAWGQAERFASFQPKIYQLTKATFSTCSPLKPSWQVDAAKLIIDKNIGRGYAKGAKLRINNIPVLYLPYLSFSLDKQRKTGFLWPSLGTSNEWGPYGLFPFYWNIAPNYDLTFTPGFLSKRGLQLSENFRYLTHTSLGKIDFSLLPNDNKFADFKSAAAKNPISANPSKNQSPSITEAEVSRILNASTTRTGFYWLDDSRFNEHWSSHLEFNYASDDYYLRNFGANSNEITQTQLLQEGDLYYKDSHWTFTGRVQSYQTLHPVDENPIANQYRRLPQLMLFGDYPNQLLGLEYFIYSEFTHFDILNNPGIATKPPFGYRTHLQPGINWPIYKPSFFLNPRVQLALTNYHLYQVNDTHSPNNKERILPIFDLASGLFFNRDTRLFKQLYSQTLEPQVYYTFIPYRNQTNIPIFDTSVNTLTYDQIFNYNRFSGIDRIGDANQLGIGVTSRFINQETGLEKIRLGIGQIIYFSSRRVTLCNDNSCTDNPQNPSNRWRRSPWSGLINYQLERNWSLTTNAIWNPTTNQMNNATISLHYQPDEKRLVNLSWGYAKNGDVLSGIQIDNSQNNIKSTDLSFAWPLSEPLSVVGRWSQDWSANHFQNLLYGLQYDTCCWAVRIIGGKAFTHLTNNTPQYNKQFYFEFALKGLGNIGTGNPNSLLGSITGYKSQFGQEL